MAIPLALIGMGVDAGFKANAAYKQNKKLDQLEATARARPKLTVPTSLQEKQNLSKNLANSSLLPAQGYYENQMGAQSARANREIQNTGGSSNDIIAGLTQVDQNSRSQLNELAAQGAANQQQNQQIYGGTLSEVAAQQNEMFDYNQNQPYQSEQLKIQSLRDSSNRNLNNAISSGIDLASNYDTGKQMDDIFGTNYYGGNGEKKIGARSTRPSKTPVTKMFNNVKSSNITGDDGNFINDYQEQYRGR